MNELLDHYRRLLINDDPNRIAEYLNFSFVIDDKLAGMALPSVRNDPAAEIRFLQESGITDLVNLTDNDYLDPGYRQTFSVLDLPVADFQPPLLEQMDRIHERFQRHGTVIAVHCVAGKGRTGVVLACLMARAANLSCQQAIEKLRRLRRGSIESHSQADFVCHYLQRHQETLNSF